MADRTMKRPLGIIDDVLVHVDKFILTIDFVILDCEVDYEVPIFGRPFLAIGKSLVDVEARELTFLVTDVIIDEISVVMNAEDTLEAVLLNCDNKEVEDSTLAVLQKRNKAIGWTLADIRRINPAFFMHKINLEEVKGVWSFLGQAGFYRSFIKDFSKVVNPLSKLLEKYAKFHFNDEFMRDFEFLKLKLTTTPIITPPNWSVPFELMCDASDVVTDWSKKLDDALWAYRTTYKMSIGMAPDRLVFGKACHLPVELQHKAIWALMKLNLEWDFAQKNWLYGKYTDRTILSATEERDQQSHNWEAKIVDSLKFACKINGQSAVTQGNVRSSPKSVSTLKIVRTADLQKENVLQVKE
uniref:Uncharacterized protein LOC104224874 n=1 Tax=Nicotiana sylvestris TaxID=4096 RepID=A0A1U7WCD2_NICSY|nr:PREDICTED: uncharacterized protein LOC104224874 [Nicotiana sylvestris]